MGTYAYSNTAAVGDPSSAVGVPRDIAEATVDLCKEELRRVTEALEIVSRSGSGEALTGRYLAQIKKCKDLGVQLAAEKAKAAAWEKKYVEEAAKHQQLLAKHAPQRRLAKAPGAYQSLAHDVATSGAKQLLGEAGGALGEREGEDDKHETKQRLRERLDRSFKMLQDRDIQLSEAHREMKAWRAVVEQETGLSPEEVERLVDVVHAQPHGKRGTKAADGDDKRSEKEVSAALEGGTISEPKRSAEDAAQRGPEATPSGARAAPKGWRGRAQQITMLQGKLKDVTIQLRESEQREHALRAQLAAAKPPNARWTDDGGKDDVQSLLALAQQEAQAGLLAPCGGPSIVGEASCPSLRSKDVDAEARQHLNQLGQRRLQQQRELEAQLRDKTLQLEEQQQHALALQSRLTAQKRETQQLRQHIQTILTKSQNDDELIATYKEELAALQADLRLARDQRRSASEHLSEIPGSGRRDASHRTTPATSPRTSISVASNHCASGASSVSAQHFFQHLHAHLCTIQTTYLPRVPAVTERGDAGTIAAAAALAQRMESDFKSLMEYVFAYLKVLETAAETRAVDNDAYYSLYEKVQAYIAEQASDVDSAEMPSEPSMPHKKKKKNAAEVGSVKQREDCREWGDLVERLPCINVQLREENTVLKEMIEHLRSLLDLRAAEGKLLTVAHETPCNRIEERGTSEIGTENKVSSPSSNAQQAAYSRLQEDYNELKKVYNQLQLRSMK